MWYADRNRYFYSYPNTQHNAHCYVTAATHAHSYSNCYSYRYIDPFVHSETYAASAVSPNSSASPVT
jgi:hypothetical protein